jgi:hypothetical protein
MKSKRQRLGSRFIGQPEVRAEILEKSESDATLDFPSRHLLINICRIRCKNDNQKT